jgi:nucleotide-binding universal stress UspA family protein
MMAIFGRLITLLDDAAPSEGAFAHALEWAWHLRLPIHAWALPSVVRDSRSDSVNRPARKPNLSDAFARKVNTCANVCAEWGVKLGLTLMEGDLTAWLQQHVEPEDLLIVSSAAGKRELSFSLQRGDSPFPVGSEKLVLIRELLRQPAAVLICPERWRSTLPRMLVLYSNQEQNDTMLTKVLDLCCCLRAKPVILTVARTEREGRRRQQPARTAFAEHGQSGNFDLLIGSGVDEAASRVARWRQCQLVVMGRYGRPQWAHWFAGSTTERLLGLADSLAVLTIPGKGISPLPSRRTATLSSLLFSGAPKGIARY